MARYLILTVPGVYVEGVGFFENGKEFDIDDDERFPLSDDLVPLDAGAHAQWARYIEAYPAKNIPKVPKVDAGIKTCTGCDRKLAPTAKFCSDCGTRVKPRPAWATPVPVDAVPDLGKAVPDQPEGTTTAAEPPKAPAALPVGVTKRGRAADQSV